MDKQRLWYAIAGRIVHYFPFQSANPVNVMDDFGNSVAVDSALVLFFARGAYASYQPESPKEYV